MGCTLYCAHARPNTPGCLIAFRRSSIHIINTLSCPSGISYVFTNSAIALLPHSHTMPMSQLCISVNFELDHDRSRSSFVTYMNDLIVILTEASLQSNTFSDNRQRSQTSSFHRFPSIFTQSSLFTFYIKTNDNFI